MNGDGEAPPGDCSVGYVVDLLVLPDRHGFLHVTHNP